jgi:hypothetical protein
VKKTYPGYGPVEVVGNRTHAGKTYLAVRTLAPSFEFTHNDRDELMFHPRPAGGELMLGEQAQQRLERFVLRDRDRTLLREVLELEPTRAPRSGTPLDVISRAKAALDAPALLASAIAELRAIGDITPGENMVRDVLEAHARVLLELP